MMSNIQVAIRVRPKIAREDLKDSSFEINDNTIKLYSKDTFYQDKFEKIFPPEASQEEIYNFIAPSIQKIEESTDNLIMAYGQTGSGKTYTMLGRDNKPGLIFRALSHIYRLAGQSYIISFSMFDIYLEEICDNLHDGVLKKKLIVREDKEIGVYIPQSTTYIIKNHSDIKKIIEKGVNNKILRLTNYSESSSRSNCISQITLTSKNVNQQGQLFNSKLSFVDLAGSELLLMKGKTPIECYPDVKKICSSLVTLRDIINLLALKHTQFIPYRNSKLTHIFKNNSLGIAGIFIIANISPTIDSLKESIDTLRFSSQAKLAQVKEKPVLHLAADNFLKTIQKEMRIMKEYIYLEKANQLSKIKDLGVDFKENSDVLEDLERKKKSFREHCKNLRYNMRYFSLYDTRYIENKLLFVKIRKNSSFDKESRGSFLRNQKKIDKEISGEGKIHQIAAKLQRLECFKIKERKLLEKYTRFKSSQDEIIVKLKELQGNKFSEINIEKYRKFDKVHKKQLWLEKKLTKP